MIGFSNATSAFYDRSVMDLTSLRKSAETLQGQISSGQRLTKSSDDPVAASRLRALTRADTLAAIDENASSRATSDLNLADSSLQSVVDTVTRAQELATQAANSTLTDAQRSSIGGELGQLYDQLIALANGRDSNGNALFGGETTGDAYTLDVSGNATYAGTSASGSISLGAGQSVIRGLTGPEVFGSDSTGLLATIKGLADALQGGSADPRGAAQAALNPLSASLDTVTTAQTVVGARLSFIDMAAQHRAALDDMRTSEESEVGSTDITGAVARLQQTMLVLEASQASFAKLSSLSLFNALG